MLILDCESRESALASVATIYGVRTDEIDGFLQNLDLDAHCSTKRPLNSSDEELRLLFEKSVGRVAAPIDRVCWFHLTRAHPMSDFSGGIQPLSASLNQVWETLLKVFCGTKHEKPLIELRRKGIPDSQYRMKTGNAFYAGPYAMLIREVAFYPRESGNHDYLCLPEIMEDICNGYEQVHGESLHDTLNCALSPKIVKFWSSLQVDHITTALHYLYRTAHDYTSTWIPNTCFDGSNKAIPPAQILRVETVEKHGRPYVPTHTKSAASTNVTFSSDETGCLVIRLEVIQ